MNRRVASSLGAFSVRLLFHGLYVKQLLQRSCFIRKLVKRVYNLSFSFLFLPFDPLPDGSVVFSVSVRTPPHASVLAFFSSVYRERKENGLVFPRDQT